MTVDPLRSLRVASFTGKLPPMIFSWNDRRNLAAVRVIIRDFQSCLFYRQVIASDDLFQCNGYKNIAAVFLIEPP